MIDELLQFFKQKASSQSPSLYEFLIYSPIQPRSFISKISVNNFRSYMSFISSNGKLFASTLSTFNPQDYAEVTFKVSKVKDSRKTKYAPKRQVTDVEVPVIMGTKSWQTLQNRIGNNYLWLWGRLFSHMQVLPSYFI